MVTNQPPTAGQRVATLPLQGPFLEQLGELRDMFRMIRLQLNAVQPLLNQLYRRDDIAQKEPTPKKTNMNTRVIIRRRVSVGSDYATPINGDITQSASVLNGRCTR